MQGSGLLARSPEQITIFRKPPGGSLAKAWVSAETSASEVGTWRETKPGYPYPHPPPHFGAVREKGRGFSPSPPSATIQHAPQGRRIAHMEGFYYGLSEVFRADIRESRSHTSMKDFKFVPLFVFLPLGFWTPNTLIKVHIPWFRDPNPRVQTLRVQRNIT